MPAEPDKEKEEVKTFNRHFPVMMEEECALNLTHPVLPFDPYYWYLSMPNLVERFRHHCSSKQSYGPYDLIGFVIGAHSYHMDMRPRKELGPNGTSKDCHDFFVGDLAFDKTYFPKSRLSQYFKNRYVHTFLPTVGLNDILSPVESTAYDTVCGPFYRDAFECIEYYGLRQGQEVCMPYLEDFLECRRGAVQKLRITAMIREKKKKWIQYKKGEISEKDYQHPLPPPNSYQEPHFTKKSFIG